MWLDKTEATRRRNTYATIYLYHGVTDAESRGIENFSRKHLSEDLFQQQMHFLSTKASVMTLRDLVEHLLRRHKLPYNTVAVTFDDTYQNVYRVALPILKKFRIPATFFITTGFVDTDRRFWTDALEHMINTTRKQSVQIVMGNQLNTFMLRTPEQRISAVVNVKAFLKTIGPQNRELILDQMQNETGVFDSGEEVFNYTNLSWAEVKSLDDPPIYEVGGHTVNHEILSFLEEQEALREIQDCLAHLRTNLGRTNDLFAYPEGQSHHFNNVTIDLLRSNGINICPAATPGVNYLGADPFRLNRNMIGLRVNSLSSSFA